MKFFLCALKTEFNTYLKDKKFLILMCLIPLFSFIASTFVSAEETLPALPVGIAIPEGSESGEELFSLLNREIGVIEFIKTDSDTLRKNVALGTWECGFILDEDFDERISRGSTSDIFTMVINEGSTLHSLVSEALSSAMLTMLAPDIGSRYLNSVGAEEPEGGYILESEFALEIIPISETEIQPEQIAKSVNQTAIGGLSAVVMTVIAISLGNKLAGRREDSYHMRVSAIIGEFAVISPTLLVEFMLFSAISWATLLILGANIGIEIFIFCLSLTAMSFLISAFPHGTMSVILPFLPPFLLVLSPVFFDVTTFFPQLKPITTLIPITHFLNISKGIESGYLGLIALILVYIIIGIFLYKRKKSTAK